MMFIQILDKTKLKEKKTRKLEQFKYLENIINEILPLRNKNQIEYSIFPISLNDLEEPMKKIIGKIDRFTK